MLLFSLRTGESFFPNSYQCSWNLTAPEDKVVLLRSARAIAPVCQGPWFHPGENCENVDFQNMNTENSSTELSDDQNGDYGLMGEYVAASKEIIHCENSTSFKKISLTTEERFIQLDSNATSCTLQFTTGSQDSSVDLSFVPIVGDTSGVNAASFTVGLQDGSDTQITSSKVNQLPFRRVQSAHSTVTLTYDNQEVKNGHSQSVFAWLRARARLPGELPRFLRATSVKSFLWVSTENLSGPDNPSVQIEAHQKCLRLQVMDPSLTKVFSPAHYFSAFRGDDMSLRDLAFDCFGKPRETFVLPWPSSVTISFHRNDSSSGFWLVYFSPNTHEECKDDATELTRAGFEYTLPSEIIERSYKCEFTMASNLTEGQQVRFRMDQFSNTVTLEEVVSWDGPKTHTLLTDGDWSAGKWVYSSYPLTLTLSKDEDSKNGSLSFSFEVIDMPDPGCGNMTLIATSEPQQLTTPYYPDMYPLNLTCNWIIQNEKPSSSYFHARKHIVIEGPDRASCNALKRSEGDYLLYVTSVAGSGLSRKPHTNVCPTFHLHFFQMFKEDKVHVTFTSDLEQVGPGLSLTYYVRERTSFEGCNKVIALGENNPSYLLDRQFFPQDYMGETALCWWIIQPVSLRAAVIVKNISVQIPRSLLYPRDMTVYISTDSTKRNTLQSFYSPTNYVQGKDDAVINPGRSLYVEVAMDRNFDAPINVSMEFTTVNASGCNGAAATVNVTTESQFLTSLDYPKLYRSGVDCEWKLKSSNNNPLIVEVVDLELNSAQGVDSCENYLLLEPSDSAKEKLCNNSNSPYTLPEHSSEVVVSFHTNTSGQGAKFRLRLQAVHSPGKKGGSSESKASIAGYACAGVAGVALIALVLFFAVRCTMRERNRSQGYATESSLALQTAQHRTKGGHL
ncbi:uncharacterized protein LOC101851629 [Aplysia californica]|uniref:Uncharacterized protein LOC101851629 n=1 Tax=Aplysia californica TaxID=6500 RepID=A0ABM0JFX5_APLCA|nr:uncharacterized protein LOC101851629 [Aplysia californica]